MSQTTTLPDAINSLFMPNTRTHYSQASNIFIFGHIIPMLVSMMVPNDPFWEGYRTSYSAFAIYGSSFLIIATQSYMIKNECASLMADAETGWIGIVGHFDMQNTVDLISILYSIFYAIFRIAFPYGTYLNPHHYSCVGDTSDICTKFVEPATPEQIARMEFHEQIPIIHVLQLCLSLSQSIFFLKLSSSRSKFIKLFVRGLLDMSAFLVIEAIQVGMITLILHCLGATFDDGDNWMESYDTNFNDYQFMSYIWVVVIANMRNAIGDLLPPTYNYWAARYERMMDQEGSENVDILALFHIDLIWVVWIIGLLINVILALNFLIAIVS